MLSASMPSTPPPRDRPEALSRLLARLREALDGRRGTGREFAKELLSAAAQQALDHVASRLERRAAREREREERRRIRARRRAQLALPVAFMFGALSLLLVAGALLLTHRDWLWIPAVIAALSAYGALSRRRMPTDLSSPLPETAPETPELRSLAEREQRIEKVAAELVADFQRAPAAVRKFVQQPQAVVDGLWDASRALAKRERELRIFLRPAVTTRLESERSALLLRVAAEPDAVAKTRLDAALGALDSQLAHRRELLVRAARLEAEGVRLLYALEGLRTQLLRALSMESGAEAGESLRRGLAQVSDELVAITEALESTGHVERVPRSGP